MLFSRSVFLQSYCFPDNGDKRDFVKVNFKLGKKTNNLLSKYVNNQTQFIKFNSFLIIERAKWEKKANKKGREIKQK